ncbi:MAG TPA: hypothetical protein VEL74_00280 [Thermoanaerobaculia bacterium]|nr:hypothetical protein [Thermoanaerobaculia bacterium]
MHNGQIHVYVEPTDGNHMVPSHVGLDSASIATGALSVGMGAVDAAGETLAAVAVPVLSSPALAGLGLETLAVVVRSDFFHYGFLFFGLVSLVLNATNLFLGFCLKGKNRSLSAEVAKTYEAKTHGTPDHGEGHSHEHEHGHEHEPAPAQPVKAPFTPRAS